MFILNFTFTTVTVIKSSHFSPYFPLLEPSVQKNYVQLAYPQAPWYNQLVHAL